MDAENANNVTQYNKDGAATDEYADTQVEDSDAVSKRDRFASQHQQRSLDYAEVVASSISYTLSSASSGPSSDSVAPLHHGDIVQIISSWSAVNDGVIQVVDGDVSAVGTVNQADKSGSVAAYFHCHNLHENINMLVLVPCTSGKFDCAMSSSAALNVVSANDDGEGVCVKTINPQDSTARNDPATGWIFERSTEDSTNSGRSETRDWRLCVYWDEKDRLKKLYLTASRTGALSLCRDEQFDCPDEDCLRNPQSYFYLYKKSHLSCS